MRRVALIVLAVAAALAPAAEARCLSKGCRKMSGHRVTVRAVVPMVAAGVRGASGAAPQPTTPAPDPTPSPAPSTAPPEPSTIPARLGVVAREWSLVLSRSTLPAGAAVVQLQNFGEDAHNLRVERLDGASGSGFDVPLAESGEVQKASGTLAPGDYRIYCTLPGHEAQGMRARFTVSAP
jgi:hypothetical protein